MVSIFVCGSTAWIGTGMLLFRHACHELATPFKLGLRSGFLDPCLRVATVLTKLSFLQFARIGGLVFKPAED